MNDSSAVAQQAGRRSRAMSFLKTLLFTIAVAFLLKTFVVEAFRIPSGSMENTLLVGDFLLVNKLAYGLKTPRYVPLTNLTIPSISLPMFGSVRRGDVVVFEYPGMQEVVRAESPVYYIKRCVGLPGDTVTIRSGRVLVNGREVLPPSLGKPIAYAQSVQWSKQESVQRMGSLDWNNFGPTVVPKKGDVINLSPESIQHWTEFIEREGHRVEFSKKGSVSIDGAETERYRVEKNYYFMLGDNRGNSLDSRFWGFVPEDYVVGEALVIYWSWNPETPGSGLDERLKNIRWARIGTLIR